MARMTFFGRHLIKEIKREAQQFPRLLVGFSIHL